MTGERERDEEAATRVALWDAINCYVVTCGGDPSAHVYGNTQRAEAVVAVERTVFKTVGCDPVCMKCRHPWRLYGCGAQTCKVMPSSAAGVADRMKDDEFTILEDGINDNERPDSAPAVAIREARRAREHEAVLMADADACVCKDRPLAPRLVEARRALADTKVELAAAQKRIDWLAKRLDGLALAGENLAKATPDRVLRMELERFVRLAKETPPS